MTFSNNPSLSRLVVSQLLVVEQQSYTRWTNTDDSCRVLNSKFLLGSLGRHKKEPFNAQGDLDLGTTALSKASTSLRRNRTAFPNRITVSVSVPHFPW